LGSPPYLSDPVPGIEQTLVEDARAEGMISRASAMAGHTRDKKELLTREEKTVPARLFPSTDIYNTQEAYP
jgi:hypothetical protein